MILNVLFRSPKDHQVYLAQFEVGFGPLENESSSGKSPKEKVGIGGSASLENGVSSHVMVEKGKLTRKGASKGAKGAKSLFKSMCVLKSNLAPLFLSKITYRTLMPLRALSSSMIFLKNG